MFKTKDEFSHTNAGEKNTEIRKREIDRNRSARSLQNNNYDNGSQRFRQLSSHHDSFEYTVMNLNRRSNTKNWRLFLIRHVILPQRSKRIFINTIHAVFSSDFRSLCSNNMLNLIVTFIVMFLLVHAIWITLAAYFAISAKGNVIQMDQRHWTNFNLLILLVTSVYPLFISLIAVIMLVQNLVCTQEYDNMFVWHRNSVIRYLQCFLGYSCLAAFQIINIELTKITDWSHHGLERRTFPLMLVSILTLLKILLVRYKNQRTGTFISLCLIT